MNPIEALYQKSLEAQKAAQVLFVEQLYSFAVGRAYYAMFYMAEAVLLTKDLSYSKHSGVIGGFNKIFVYTEPIFEPMMSELLSEGFDMRNVGDYDTYTHITKDQAQDLLEKSLFFCEKIRYYLSENGFLR